MNYKHLFPMVVVGILALVTVLGFLVLLRRSMVAPVASNQEEEGIQEEEEGAHNVDATVDTPESPHTVMVRVFN